MKRQFSQLVFLILVLVSGQGFSQSMKLSSPDGKLSVTIRAKKNTDSIISYDLSYGGISILKAASAGFVLKDQPAVALKFLKSTRKTVATSWTPVYGERKSIPDNYQQLTLDFRCSSNPSFKVVLYCRAYNEGFAFRYGVQQGNKPMSIEKELSLFPVNPMATAWVSTMAQSVLQEKKITAIDKVVERPLTVKLNEKLFLALGEAALVDFARMKFRQTDGKLVSELDGPAEFTGKLTSPWRYVLVGKSPGDLLEKNYLVLNLNEPNQIKNTAWIKPGKVIREATLTTTGAINCIDFAAKHHLKYILFDAGWYGKEDADTSDATHVALDPARSKGPLDLQKVIAYGKQKNVGVILYVNRRALERQLDTLLPLYQSWGVKGLKFGFVQVGSQKWTAWLHEAIRKAAKYQLMVDVHDEYRPTGYSRTYPNLLTQEGIRGDEETIFTEHSITTLFTRMIAGAGDNTNCYFTNRSDKMGSHAAQLAKAVCIYSPWQFLFWYDRPVSSDVKNYKEGEVQEVPELSWFDNLPTVWDATRVLESNMTDYATIARKKGNEWFLGSLSGTTGRQVNINCNFLDRNKNYTAVVYTDDETVPTPTRVRITTQKVNAGSVLSFTIAERNGIAIHFKPE